MKLKNFDWNENTIDQATSDEARYTTYDGYGVINYPIEPLTGEITEPKIEELSAL